MTLIVLSFTGIWMFFQLRGARSKRGRKDWFLVFEVIHLKRVYAHAK